MNSHPTPERGFSLMELAIVMAIIAILAVLAIPVFFTKVPRNQVEESIPLVKIAKDRVANYYFMSPEKAMPANNDVAGLPAPEKISSVYVSSVTVVNGAINMTFRKEAHAKIAGKTLTWRPVVNMTLPNVEWVCGYKKIPDDPNLKVGGQNATDVQGDFLPFDCRGPGEARR